MVGLTGSRIGLIWLNSTDFDPAVPRAESPNPAGGNPAASVHVAERVGLRIANDGFPLVVKPQCVGAVSEQRVIYRVERHTGFPVIRIGQQIFNRVKNHENRIAPRLNHPFRE